MVVTFCGHRDCPNEVLPGLRQVLEKLIQCKDATKFYVGNEGRFDCMVQTVLCQLQSKYPYICYEVVLAYLPSGDRGQGTDNTPLTLYPEELDTVPKRYAISHRNRWMVDHADCLVSYIEHDWGGAAKMYQRALNKGLTVINLGKNEQIQGRNSNKGE